MAAQGEKNKTMGKHTNLYTCLTYGRNIDSYEEWWIWYNDWFALYVFYHFYLHNNLDIDDDEDEKPTRKAPAIAKPPQNNTRLPPNMYNIRPPNKPRPPPLPPKGRIIFR